jgi:hypothetical protein
VFIFGGQDDDNTKLNDLWVLDLTTEQFSEVTLGSKSHHPAPRSGHSANVFNGKMYIFGGILELTKELNELLCYNFKTKEFELIGSHSPGEEAYRSGSKVRDEEVSPGMRKNAQARNQGGMSPSKLGKSPTKKRGASPMKKHKEEEKGKKKESGLASPTSISMQNSFIIKNADESFDAYYIQMKKRKHGLGTFDGTMPNSSPGNASPGLPETNFGIVQGIQPAARDGHSTNISEDGMMYVFGGDRHHMPFNDLYVLQLS